MQLPFWLRRAAAFTALAYMLSWNVAGLLYALGVRSPSLGSTLGGVLFMFGPFAAAAIVQRRAREPLAPAIGWSLAFSPSPTRPSLPCCWH